MRKLSILLSLCFITSIYGQDEPVLQWINTNAIVIEDADQNAPFTAFAQKVPQGFKDARIFGFGEASHHGKEFFDIKAKFFKYLVENHGVNIFMMEESYQAEEGINEWITGGEGDVRSILGNFGQGIWRSKEVAGLLEWMRDYNQGKPYNEQIRFYGIDNQFGYNISTRLRKYVQKHSISVDERLLTAADSCSKAKLQAKGVKNWDAQMLPDLRQIRQMLEENKSKLAIADEKEYKDMMRALDYLEQYTAHIAAPYNHRRESDMYDNVSKIMELVRPGSKAFIWAHNEHINKKNLGGYKIENLGNRLKTRFANEYYAVGFDFGNGSLTGYNIQDGKNLGRVVRTLEKPYKKTFAETLARAHHDIYFVDMSTALENPVAAKFFSTRMKQLFLGGPGFDPENNFFIKRKFTEAYDAIIFIKSISPTTY